MGDFDEAVGIISSLSKRVIAEEGHHGNPTEVFEYKVIGRSPSGEANLLQTPEGHIIERIATGKQRGWWKVIIGKTEYVGMTPESTIGIAKSRGAIPEAMPEGLERVRATTYYRGVSPEGIVGKGRIGQYFTSARWEAEIYGKKVTEARITPQNPLYSETAVDAAEKLGVLEEYDALIATDPIAADDVVSRKALEQGYDSIIRRDGGWVVTLKPEIIAKPPAFEISVANPSVPGEELPPDHEMLLHFGIEEVGSPGIVLDEAKARATPCSCFTYKSKDLCWSKGIIGLLTQPQQNVYCVAGKAYKAQPALTERYTKFAAAAERAHKEIESMPKGTERLEVWLSAMGRELSREGIEV